MRYFLRILKEKKKKTKNNQSPQLRKIENKITHLVKCIKQVISQKIDYRL